MPPPGSSAMPAYSNIRSPIQAARELTAYVNSSGANLGKKGSPSSIVQAAQRDMKMTAKEQDGIFGKVTKNKAAQLLLAEKYAKPTAKPAPKPVAKPAPKPAPKPAAKAAAAKVAAKPKATLAPAPKPAAKLAATKAAVVAAAAPKPAPEPTPIVDPWADEPVSAHTPETVYPPIVDPYEQIQPADLPEATQQAVSSISANDKCNIIDALNNFSRAQSATKADYEGLIATLADKFSPALSQIANQVELQVLQREATSDHNSMMKADERWQQNQDSHQAIMDKLAELIKVMMANNSVSQLVYKVYGVHL